MKDSPVGKGYSYFFAFILLGLMGLQTVRVEMEFPKNQLPEIKSFSVKEIPETLAIAQIGLIACLLGVPTDGIAIKLAKLLQYKIEENQEKD